MVNHNKNGRTGKVINCYICGKEKYKSKSDYEKVKDGRHTCSRECRGLKQTLINKEQLELKLGVACLRDYLIEKYHNRKLNTREIAVLVYGKKHYSPNILGWMDNLKIDRRCNSESIAMQWEGDDERRLKQSEFAKRKFAKGTDGRNKLIKVMQTEDYRSKASQSKIGRKNPMWKEHLTEADRRDRNGKSANARWVREVKRRDGHTCQCCGIKDITMVAHHLNGYNWDVKNRYNTDNGVTLCEPCHKLFHKRYGYSNNTKKQYIEFVKKIKSKKHKQLALL